MKKLSKYEVVLSNKAESSFVSAVLAFAHCHNLIKPVEGLTEQYTDEVPAIKFALTYYRCVRKLALMGSPFNPVSAKLSANTPIAHLIRLKIVNGILQHRMTTDFLLYVSRMES